MRGWITFSFIFLFWKNCQKYLSFDTPNKAAILYWCKEWKGLIEMNNITELINDSWPRVFERENRIGHKHLAAQWIARLICTRVIWLSEIKMTNLKKAIEGESIGRIFGCFYKKWMKIMWRRRNNEMFNVLLAETYKSPFSNSIFLLGIFFIFKSHFLYLFFLT